MTLLEMHCLRISACGCLGGCFFASLYLCVGAVCKRAWGTAVLGLTVSHCVMHQTSAPVHCPLSASVPPDPSLWYLSASAAGT